MQINQKVSLRLAEKAESLDSDGDTIDVIVELERLSTGTETVESACARDKTSQIAARKESFARISSPVVNAVIRVGGEVTDKIWLNRTLRVRLPAKGLQIISRLREVEKLDTLSEIEQESSK